MSKIVNAIDMVYGPELTNAAGMREVIKWERLHVAKDRPPLLVSREEHNKQQLELCRPGWFVYFDGAMRSNSGSLSELEEPPTDKYLKWKRISEYRCILLNRANAAAAQLKHELLQQAINAERKGHGGEPDSDEIDRLRQMAERAKKLNESFRKALHFKEKFQPKQKRRLDKLKDENYRFAYKARGAIEKIKLPTDTDRDPEPEEMGGPRELPDIQEILENGGEVRCQRP
jgi:hypothetical protein